MATPRKSTPKSAEPVEVETKAVFVRRPDLANKLVLSIVGVILLGLTVVMLSGLRPAQKEEMKDKPTETTRTSAIASNNLKVVEIRSTEMMYRDSSNTQRTTKFDARVTFSKNGPPPVKATREDIKVGSTVNIVVRDNAITSVHIVTQ